MMFGAPSRWSSLSFALFLLAATLYSSRVLSQGWTPADEGVLAQTAERTTYGEVPHLDFDEPYSGGLTWLNALAFRLFGFRLVSMRIPLLGFYLVFLAAFYFVARRWFSPAYAALLGLGSLGWGVVASFVALPSWYLSFFAGFG